MTARWQATHSYTAGDLILPTVDNGRVYACSTTGTSGGTEPTWPARYPAVTDGSAAWMPYTVILPSSLRTLMGWDTNASSQVQPNHTDNVLGNYLLDAIDAIEKATRRYFVDKPGKTWQTTSYGRPILALPGLRSASSVTYQGAVQTAGIPGQGSGYMLLPDALQTGVYTSISFRPLRVSDSGPWWLSLGGASTNWFDTGADNPYDPRNYGGGYVFTSTELDTIIVGDWGYAPGSEPNAFVHALEVLAGWYAMRPLAILADQVITPQGGIMSYADQPPEFRAFLADWTAGQQVVSVG